jgi:tRNA(Ile)-lysidine synthase
VPPERLTSAEIARFRNDARQLIDAPGEARVGVAVSGGPDSMAMLLLAHAAFPGAVEAATVDHRLRATSSDEAALVSRFCATLDVPHSVLTVDVARDGNLSDRARTARYAALEAWRVANGLACVMTAHHADDQLETVIMRLNRGSGVGGLAGIRARQGQVVRPLLGWRRAELAGIVAGLDTVADPSNTDDRFDRARLRKLLAGADWLDPLAVTASAAHVADADAALDTLTPCWRQDGNAVTLPFDIVAELPWELRRRTLLAGLRALAPDTAPRADTLRRLDAAIAARETMAVGEVIARVIGVSIQLSAAPARRSR